MGSVAGRTARKGLREILPPLAHNVRQAVKNWRDKNYIGASDTSKALLIYWLNKEIRTNNPFTYYFVQRESIESIIYLYEVFKASDKYELLKLDSSGRISLNMFPETWTRYVIKMATGSGKTKVMSLAIVWSYFHKLYEKESNLSKNFLVIAPNIIVLNRLLKDFNNFDIFRNDPLLPDNGYKDRDWQNDFFRITLHIQDEVKQINDDGNIFVSNIHRVYVNNKKTYSIMKRYKN